MIDFFIDRPIFSTVLAIIITIAGAVSLTALPIARYRGPAGCVASRGENRTCSQENARAAL